MFPSSFLKNFKVKHMKSLTRFILFMFSFFHLFNLLPFGINESLIVIIVFQRELNGWSNKSNLIIINAQWFLLGLIGMNKYSLLRIFL